MRFTLEQRTAALLALVEQYRRARCAELMAPAQEQARALLRTALAEGRRRVHTAIGEARQRIANELGAAQARLATERRLAEQARAVEVLHEAWTALRAALRARWTDAASRERWVDAHLARALATLPRGPWRIEHAEDWPAAERERVAAQLAAAQVGAVDWQPRAEIDAGLRVRAGNNVVDATADGLLADRAALEGRLLDLLQETSG